MTSKALDPGFSRKNPSFAKAVKDLAKFFLFRAGNLYPLILSLLSEWILVCQLIDSSEHQYWRRLHSWGARQCQQSLLLDNLEL